MENAGTRAKSLGHLASPPPSLQFCVGHSHLLPWSALLLSQPIIVAGPWVCGIPGPSTCRWNAGMEHSEKQDAFWFFLDCFMNFKICCFFSSTELCPWGQRPCVKLFKNSKKTLVSFLIQYYVHIRLIKSRSQGFNWILSLVWFLTPNLCGRVSKFIQRLTISPICIWDYSFDYSLESLEFSVLK